MSFSLNLCTAVLPDFSFEDAVETAAIAGYRGIELRVGDRGHKSLDELSQRGGFIKRHITQTGLQVPILNSYIPVNHEAAVDQLIYCCQKMAVPQARLVLPRSCQAAVAQRTKLNEVIPSYAEEKSPREIVDDLRKQLRQIERKAAQAGIKLLLELHWGTVMSSFSSAYWLTQDLNPNHIGITFDPANMMVEGKEDWEFGLQLIRPHLANVHVKNMIWAFDYRGWAWRWTPITQGMVSWSELILLLTHQGYLGDYAIEDFTTPNNSKQSAIRHLSWARLQFEELYENFSPLALSYSAAGAIAS